MKPTSNANPKEKIEELGRRIDHLHRLVLELDVPMTPRSRPMRGRWSWTDCVGTAVFDQ